MRARPVIVSALLAVCASLALAGPSAASHEIVVYLTKTGFAPASSSIAVGDRVRFTVRDHKPHQVAKTSGPSSGAIPPTVLDERNNSLTLFPADAGTYAYIDRLNAARAQFRLTVRR